MSFGGMKHDYTAFKTIVLVLGIVIKSYMKKNLTNILNSPNEYIIARYRSLNPQF